MLSRSVDGVIGVSRYILQRHLDLGLFADAEKRVIRDIREPGDVKLERLPRHQLTFGYIGQLKPLKGIELLIDAFRTSRFRSDTRLLIAGRGKPEYEANLRAGTADLPIDWLGWIEPANFYRRVDVAVVPSLWGEPLAGVVIEAHCCGVPTVVSANGGTPEMVEDGKTGFIYRRDTVEELAGTLLRFVDEPHLVNGMRPSILEAAKRYAAPVIAREHLELYDVLRRADFLKRPLAHRHQ